MSMTERPILFSGPMVRAIIDGRKTQTRRPVKLGGGYDGSGVYELRDGTMSDIEELCPYGRPGDRLWVRETFTIETNYNLDPCDPPFKDGRPIKWDENEDMGRWWEQPHYRATDPAPDLVHEDDCKQCEENGYCNSWKPSIHMPRWASRITLEITKVRVERLQDIDEAGARSEGSQLMRCGTGHDSQPIKSHRTGFVYSWNSIYAARGFGWDKNPWVWIVDFKRV